MREPVGVPGRRREVQVFAEGRETQLVPYAGTYVRRLIGLLFGGSELLLDPCSSVHGFGMRASIDVAYINRDGQVIDVSTLKPWRAHARRPQATVAWEAPPGRFQQMGIVPGTQLRFAEA